MREKSKAQHVESGGKGERIWGSEDSGSLAMSMANGGKGTNREGGLACVCASVGRWRE